MKRNALTAPLLLLPLLVGCATVSASADDETSATDSTITASSGAIVTIDCPSKSSAANLVITIDRAKSTATVVQGDRVLAAVRPTFGIYSSADFSLSEHTGSMTTYSLKLDAQTTEVLRITRTDII